jgi:hypothetical protein
MNETFVSITFILFIVYIVSFQTPCHYNFNAELGGKWSHMSNLLYKLIITNFITGICIVKCMKYSSS